MDATKKIEFGVKYAGFWKDDAAVKGIFSTTAAATADGIVSLDELLEWEWNWTGNSDVSGFSIDSTNGSASALVPPGGFIIGGVNTAVDASFNDADDLDQGVYESGEQVIDLGALLVEDFAAGTTAIGDASAVGSISVSPIVEFALNYSGFWTGGGAINGIFSASEADAADGIVSLDELVSWQWNWTGNSEVAAFSLSSADGGTASSLIPPDGFKIGGMNTPVALDFSDADGLDQGLYESATGDQVIDLGALVIEDFNAGTIALGDVTANGTIAASKVLNFTTEFSGYWNDDGGGAITGGFTASAADAADGVVSIDELISWNWNWTGNSKVDAFSIDSTGGTATALIPPGGFLVDGNKVLDVDFNAADKLDQGLYESADGSKLIDIGALIIEDFTAGSFTTGVVELPPVTEPPVDTTPKTLFGNLSNSPLEGGAGNDNLFGNAGATTLIGNAGNDKIYGSDLAENITGGKGDDIIYANGGRDYIDAGSGLDQVWLGGASESTVVLNQGDGYTTIVNYQAGSTRLKVSSLDGLSLTNSANGLEIAQAGDLLAVVTHQTKNTFDSGSLFTA
ncbi:MAG: hypothetical protein HC805_05130 [Alkalinema sp. RL_2_19]|nr:hypothetical protein [Alkalinema sp. RL_2_19]